ARGHDPSEVWGGALRAPWPCRRSTSARASRPSTSGVRESAEDGTAADSPPRTRAASHRARARDAPASRRSPHGTARSLRRDLWERESTYRSGLSALLGERRERPAARCPGRSGPTWWARRFIILNGRLRWAARASRTAPANTCSSGGARDSDGCAYADRIITARAARSRRDGIGIGRSPGSRLPRRRAWPQRRSGIRSANRVVTLSRAGV